MAEAAPQALDDVMLAMDVVDTLRHRQRLVARELGQEARDDQLIERLREIYAGQGIEIPDSVLAEGVEALKESRFTYEPPQPGLSVSLARLYVTRASWGKWAIGAIGVLLAGWLAYVALVEWPAARHAEATRIALTKTLPADLDRLQKSIALEARDRADTLVGEAKRAIAAKDADAARKAIDALAQLEANILSTFSIRIVCGLGATTGVWRVLDDNTRARNYYLIVGALRENGDKVTLTVMNEETQKASQVSRWGERVGEGTFESVRRDKQDDGIIQRNILAQKEKGNLAPTYLMPVLGGRITKW